MHTEVHFVMRAWNRSACRSRCFRPFAAYGLGVLLKGDEVVAKTGLPPSEASRRRPPVLLIREIGRPVRRRELTKRAEEQGISLETVTVSLSYSNVIASKNGYFAVIGDPKLEEFGDSEVAALVEDLTPPKESEESQLVPDENSDEFPGLLMFAVEARVAELELTAPWSVSELRLCQHDRERLLAWGQLAEWDFHDDARNYQTKHGEKCESELRWDLHSCFLHRKQSDDLVTPVLYGQRSNASWVSIRRTYSCFVPSPQTCSAGGSGKRLPDIRLAARI